MAELKDHLVFWQGVYRYYKADPCPFSLQIYIEDTADLSKEQLYEAFKLWRHSPKGAFMPKGSELAKMFNTTADPKSDANEAASLIWDSIGRFGRYNHHEARDHMGELAWEIVQRDGGWSRICENVTNDMKGTLKAQWREMGLGLIDKSQKGILGKRPSLPGPQIKSLPGAKSIGQILKEIE